MINENHILDKNLPLSQNFSELKKEGLAYIEQFGSTEWTNLNQSDPGVTILDQLCFALTELGYCGDFSIEDILANSQGEIDYKNQFNLPYDILTTTPITIDDYRKIIIDNFPNVINALLVPIKSSGNLGNTYNVFLYVDSAITNIERLENIQNAVFITLNNFRNINEFFNTPIILKPVTFYLQGVLQIDSLLCFEKIIIDIQEKVNAFIFSDVRQYGYDVLTEDGVATNSIFNGPQLKNGWILSNELSDKKDTVTNLEIGHLISSINGVIEGSNFMFSIDKELEMDMPSISVFFDQLIKFEIVESFNLGFLKCYNGEVNIKDTIYPNGLSIRPKLYSKTGDMNEVSSVQLIPDLPEGSFRDIEDYYSIQNTFPEVYSVGPNAKNANASEFQIAQSKQLMGYLTLFDQVLANQFAQLANVGTLFSFKNTVHDLLEEDGIKKNRGASFDKMFSEFPEEYVEINPSYYYQSLYEVPNIRPILKRNETFDFIDGLDTTNKIIKDSWVAYKNDPYNPYIKGLKDFIEDQQVNIERRNDVLDHLLARNGESPLMIDMFLAGSLCTGNSKKDIIIYKSLYLQNLGLLSYYRVKSFNIIGAKRINPNVEKAKKKLDKIIQAKRSKMFLFNPSYLYKIQKLHPADFVNYAAIELKLNLLFGLTVQYLNFIKSNYEKVGTEVLNQILWFLYERKGLIMIEPNLLFRSGAFRVNVVNSSGNECFRFKDRLTYHELTKIRNTIENQNKANIFNAINNGIFSIENKKYKVNVVDDALQSDEVENRLSIKIVNVKWGKNKKKNVSFGPNTSDVNIFLPLYIPQFGDVSFQQRLDVFLKENLPVNIKYKVFTLSFEEMELLIPAFVNYRNSLSKNSSKKDKILNPIKCTNTLVTTLNKLNKSHQNK